jgi:hypothetical protein
LLFSSILYKSKLNFGPVPVDIGRLGGGETHRWNNGDAGRLENGAKLVDEYMGI